MFTEKVMFSPFDSHGVAKETGIFRSRVGVDYLPDGRVVERALPGIDAQVAYLEAHGNTPPGTA